MSKPRATDGRWIVDRRPGLEELYEPEPMSGCWLWVGSRDQDGYGHWWDGRVASRAHRAMWAVLNGPIPIGLCVLHRCDNPPCVNPGHLFLGTRRENSQDMVRKCRSRGPHLKGEAQAGAKLTDAVVLSIRRRYRRGNGLALAAEYGVSQSLISLIILRKAWKHLDPPLKDFIKTRRVKGEA